MELFSSKVALIVCREVLEALLVIGILYGFLIKTKSRRGMAAMWAGVFGGLVLSALIGVAMLTVDRFFTDRSQFLFEACVMGISALLMTHMVFWMHRHGRHLKKHLEENLAQALKGVNWIAIGLISGLAVLREGTETVLFIYGLSFELQHRWVEIGVSAAAGFVAAFIVFIVLAKGFSFLKQKVVFRVTEIVLLLASAGLIANMTERLVARGLVPGLVEPLWNTSHILPANGPFTFIFVTWFGYNPRPSMVEVLVYAAYWLLVVLLWRREKKLALPKTSPMKVTATSSY